MRLKSLYLKEYKNLKEINVNFNENNIDILIGKNGVGKSNFLEAIIQIFLFAYEGREFKDIEKLHDFKLIYFIGRNEGTLTYIKDGDLTLDVKSEKGKIIRYKHIYKKFLPETILLYYAGHNGKILKLAEEYEQKFRVKRNTRLHYEKRKLSQIFGITKEHREILLLLIFIQNSSNVKDYILAQLGVEDIFLKGKLVLKAPNYASKRKKYDSMGIISEVPEEHLFWGMKGDIQKFLLELLEGNTGDTRENGDEGFIFSKQKYFITLDKNVLLNSISQRNIFTIFRLFDDLRTAGMIDEIKFNIKKNNEEIPFSNLSEGELQTIIYNAVLEIFKNQESLLLLDEPDAFLHPEWQINLLENIQTINLENKNHILINSHSAATILDFKEKVILFRKESEKLLCNKVQIDFATKVLSSHYIKLNSQNRIIDLIEKVKKSKKPLLLTEGVTDAKIIYTAWSKLNDTEIPFDIIPVLGDAYLNKLLKDDKFVAEVGAVPIFGLYDFDEAYNYWLDMKNRGQIIEADPFKGMTAKIKDANIYTILLPVPNNEQLKKQVIKNRDTLETFAHESRLSIELLFFQHLGISEYFETAVCIGGGEKIIFKYNKDKFAENIVPTLPTEAFDEFKKIFTNITNQLQIVLP